MIKDAPNHALEYELYHGFKLFVSYREVDQRVGELEKQQNQKNQTPRYTRSAIYYLQKNLKNLWLENRGLPTAGSIIFISQLIFRPISCHDFGAESGSSFTEITELQIQLHQPGINRLDQLVIPKD